MLVGGAVDEGQHDVETRTKRRVIFAEALDHPGVLLRHHVDGLEDEHHRDDEEDEAETAETDFHLASFRFYWLFATTSRLPRTSLMTNFPGSGCEPGSSSM